MPSALLDNDIIEKMAKWLCLDRLPEAISATNERVFVLGALKYVVGKRLSNAEYVEASEQLDSFLSKVEELEPTDDEVSLAAFIEESSITAGVDIDIGESQLFAVAVSRDDSVVATGDKRAVCGCASIEPHVPDIGALRGRVFSTEQILAKLVDIVGYDDLRQLVCAVRTADKTADICFACGRASTTQDNTIGALLSYQKDLAAKSNNFTAGTLDL